MLILWKADEAFVMNKISASLSAAGLHTDTFLLQKQFETHSKQFGNNKTYCPGNPFSTTCSDQQQLTHSSHWFVKEMALDTPSDSSIDLSMFGASFMLTRLTAAAEVSAVRDPRVRLRPISRCAAQFIRSILRRVDPQRTLLCDLSLLWVFQSSEGFQSG